METKEEKINIHSGHRQRVRKKIASNGFNSLFQHELLEYILFNSITQGDTNATAHRLLAHFGSIEAVFSATVEELMQIKGIGEASALLLSSYGYVHKLIIKNENTHKAHLKERMEFENYLKPFFLGKQNEEFYVLLLDSNFKLIRQFSLKSPVHNKVSVNIEPLMTMISVVHPFCVVFVHNHPSGNLTPSPADISFTKRLYFALKLSLNIILYDHLILNCDYDNFASFSFRENGILELFEKSN